MQADDTHFLCRCGCGTPVKTGHHFLTGSHLNSRFTAEERFWLCVEKASGDACWSWYGSMDPVGYGRIMVDGERIKAHRYAWTLAAGIAPPDEFDVLHTCDTPGCTKNDDVGVYVVDGVDHMRFGHLWVGTHTDNMRDKMSKGRGNHLSYPPEHYARGVRASGAKLTDAVVLEIRRLRCDGRSMNSLGKQFGVDSKTIEAIIKRRTWVHI